MRKKLKGEGDLDSLNRPKAGSGGTSKYRGVRWSKSERKWRAEIRVPVSNEGGVNQVKMMMLLMM